MNKSSPLVVPAAIALLTVGNFYPLAHAYPGNRERYDCYRKSDNQFSFGSPENASNSRVLCTPNPDYRSRPSSQRSFSPRQRNTSNRQNVNKTVYKNVYRRGDNTGEKVAIGLGSFAFGALIGSVFSPWGWGWGGWGWGGGWGGWGDTFIDNSVNNVDFGDLNVDVGNIGDVDASIGDIDFGDVDASGDEIGVTDFGGDDPNVDASSDEIGATDFGGDDGGGFQENDFGGDDYGGGDYDAGGFDDGGGFYDGGGFDDGGFDGGGDF